MSATMDISGHEFDAIGQIQSKSGQAVPLLDIPMMSDEKWQEMCLKSAREEFKRTFDKEPPSDKEVSDWNTAKIRKVIDETILIENIIIPTSYKATPPAERKLVYAREFYKQYGLLAPLIVISDNNVLIDGYTAYLVAEENGFKEVTFARGFLKTIVGLHPNCDKQYEWKVPVKLLEAIRRGDKVKVCTKHGIRKVTVVKVEYYGVINPNANLNTVLGKVAS